MSNPSADQTPGEDENGPSSTHNGIGPFTNHSLLIVSLLSLGISAWMFNEGVISRTPPGWLPFAFVGLAAAGLWGLGRLFYFPHLDTEANGDRFSPASADAGGPWAPRLAVILSLVAVIATADILLRLPALTSDDRYLYPFVAWGVAVVAILIAARTADPRPRRPERPAYAEFLMITGLMGIAALARLPDLGTLPFTLGGDEASQGLEALRVIDRDLRNPFATGWLGVPTMSFFFNSLSLRLSTSIASLRLPWALVGISTAGLTFALVKQVTKDQWLALGTAFAVATYHYHVHFSRLGSNQVADPFFVVVALLFLYRALQRHRYFDWALTGAFCAMGLYFYAGARFTSVVTVALIGYEFLRAPRRFWVQHDDSAYTHFRGLLAALGSFAVVGGPMLQYAYRFPNDFNARVNQVGIIQSGWLTREIELTGSSIWMILLNQFERAALAFNHFPDRTVWYGLRTPLLDPLSGVIFLSFLILATIRIWRFDRVGSVLAPFVAWWWGGMLLGGVLTESPPSSMRLITLAIPVCFLVSWGIMALSRAAGRLLTMPFLPIYMGGMVLFAAMSLYTYFVEYAPQRIYGGPHAGLATDLAPLLNEYAESHRTYFVGPPHMYWEFATIPYLAPTMAGQNIESPVDDLSLDSLDLTESGAIFVVLGPRMAELPAIQSVFPDGELREYVLPVDTRPVAVVYIVPKNP